MTHTKPDVAAALEHQRALLASRQRLQTLEEHEMACGGRLPADDIAQLDRQRALVRESIAAIAQLQTELAVDTVSVSEAAYRVRLAEAWSHPLGRPSLVEATRLEVFRLRLGIPATTAKDIELLIRTAAVMERLQLLEGVELWRLWQGEALDESVLKAVRAMLRTETAAAVLLLKERLPDSPVKLDFETACAALLNTGLFRGQPRLWRRVRRYVEAAFMQANGTPAAPPQASDPPRRQKRASAAKKRTASAQG